MEDLSSLIGRSYKTGKILGSGTFGDVYKGYVTSSDQEKKGETQFFAIKCFDDQRCFYGIHYTAIREIKYLREFDAQEHPNIIKLHDVYMDGKTVNLVLDYCLFDLAHIISDKPNSFKNVSKDPSAIASARAEGKWAAFCLRQPDGDWASLTAAQLFDFQSAKPKRFKKNMAAGRWEYVGSESERGRPLGVDVQWCVLPLGDIKRLAADICSAVDFVHSHSVVHQDLKPGNFFLNSDGVLKLGDFGLARDAGSNMKRKVRAKGTTWYRPPEMLFGSDDMTFGVDLWAVGCIVAELFLRRPLLAGDSELGQITAITRTLGFPTAEEWPGKNDMEPCRLMAPVSAPPLERFLPAACPSRARDLITRLLRFDHAKRMPCAEVLKHGLFTLAPPPCDRKALTALKATTVVVTPEPPAVSAQPTTTSTGTKRKLGRITRSVSAHRTRGRRREAVVAQALFGRSSDRYPDTPGEAQPSASKRKRSDSNDSNDLTSGIFSFTRTPPSSSSASMARALFGT